MIVVFGNTGELEKFMLSLMILLELCFTNESILDDVQPNYSYLLTRVYHDLQASPGFKWMIAT